MRFIKAFSAQFLALLVVLGVSCSLSANTAPPPEALMLASVNAAVAHVGDDELLYHKHADRLVPIASLTKLMTALVVVESGAPMDEWLEVFPRHMPAEANAYSRIRKSSELKRRDMLRIALMSSENLAAYTLARHHPGGYDEFVAEMN
ncbi:MAG: D-alanyl-D-alanine endopeptidase, partial [Oleiphilaceae bacterium]|nr:D-alanyl-D-alanine endopeptidase [Oleiphilaceae bacterium]